MLGATNRINDIDEAILRRMPKKFAIPLPDKQQRMRILQLVLGDTRTDPDHFDMDFVAKVTAGMSGSDIKEACRDAAMIPMREYIRQHRASGAPMTSVEPSRVRGLRTEDFFGRKGGNQSLLAQDIRRSKESAKKPRRTSSSSGYETVEEEQLAEVVD